MNSGEGSLQPGGTGERGNTGNRRREAWGIYRAKKGRGQGLHCRKSRGDSSRFCPRNHRREEEDGVTSRVTSRRADAWVQRAEREGGE